MKNDRLGWWNSDFLALMANRLNFDTLNSVIDFGCGNGHWLQLLNPHFRPNTLILGLDNSLSRLENCLYNRDTNKPKIPLRVLGTAQQAPIKEGSFDLATCQTLLTHLQDPQKTVNEMARVVRPGGMVLCAEPNNLDNAMNWSSILEQGATETVLILYETWMRFRRGRIIRGKGDNNLGSFLPKFLQQANLKQIQVWQTDRPNIVFPPYIESSKSGLINNDEIEDDEDNEFYQLEFDEFASNLYAGGANTNFIEIAWNELNLYLDRMQQQIQENRFHATASSRLFLAVGIKRHSPRK